MIHLFKIENVKELRLYKNRKFFPHSIQGDKRSGNVFILAGMSQADSVSTLNSNVIETRFIPGYFVDRLINVTVNGVIKKERLDLKQTYTAIKDQATFITRTFPAVAQYRGLNVFYDIQRYNDIFFSSGRTGSPAKRAELYADYLYKIVTKPEFASYPNKKIIIPIDGMGLTRQDASPIGCMLYLLFNSEEKFHKVYDNMEFLLIGEQTKTLIRFKGSSLTRRTMPKLVSLVSIVDKVNKKQSLTAEEQALFNETEADFKYASEVKIKETPVTIIMHQLAQSITGLANPWEDLDSEQMQNLDKAEEIAERIYNSKENVNAEALLDELNNNEEFVGFINQVTQEQLTAKAKRANTKRNELLQREQGQQRINNTGKTLEEILNDFETRKMDREYYDINISNEQLKTSTLKDFEVSYNKKQKDKDTIAILNSFSKDKEIPLYIRKIEREDTTTPFDKKETWSVLFEDDRRVRHTVTFDMPLFIDDHFLYLSESKKSISHQLMLMPVVKTGPDTVQCISNYNKAFITRYGQKISPKIERLKKLLAVSKSNAFKYLSGDSSSVNTKFLTNMDFDELANTFGHIEIGDLVLTFNQPDLRNELKEKCIAIDGLKEEELPIGLDSGKLVVLNVNTGLIKGTTKDLPDFIVDRLVARDPNLLGELEKVTVSKKYVYSRVSVLARKFPLILLLAYHEGLTAIMKKAKIKYSISDKRKRLTLDEKNRIGEIKFADGYLYYDLYPFRNSLLLNALQELPTEDHELKEFDNKEVYLELFEMMFGSRNVAKGFSNFIHLFLDPITLEVCQDNDLPTDFTGLLLYANALLEDNAFTTENKMSLYRIRSNEIVNGLLYKVLADAYAKYTNTANNTTPIKMSIPRDKVIKEINACTIISDYSCINPIAEVEAYGGITYKGPSGLNVDEAFTLPKRSYDATMLGLIGMSSPYNNKVGISRQLAFNPRILNNRGYIIPGKKGDKGLDMANVMTPAEILTPMAANHDDSPRTA